MITCRSFLLSAVGVLLAVQTQAQQVRDSAGIDIVENSVAAWSTGTQWRIAPEPFAEIGGVEEDPNHVLYRVRAAFKLPDGRVVVANGGSGELRFYGSEGRFLMAAGGEGAGPGEFRGLRGVHRMGDSLVAYDSRLQRLSFFDTTGAYYRSTRLQPLANGMLPTLRGIFRDGTMLVYATRPLMYPVGLSRIEIPHYRYDLSGSVIDSLGSYPFGEIFTEARSNGGRTYYDLLFGRSTAIPVGDEHYYVADNSSYEIQVYTKAGRLQRVIRKKHEPLNVTSRDIRVATQKILTAVANEIWRRRGERVFAQMPLPETLPSYGWNVRGRGHWVVPDDVGNLWVLEYDRPGQEQRRWTVFDAKGFLLGTLRFPTTLEPMHIGDDFVVGLWRDPDNVEHVQLYDLIKPER